MIGARATDVRLGPPLRGKESSARPTRGRCCAEAGCTTILSTYNDSPTCYVHTAPTYRHPLARD